MQPESSKHGRIADESLAREARDMTEGNHGSRRSMTEDEPAIDRDGIALRSELAATLRRTLFPARRDALLTYADQQNVTDSVRELLESLPAETEFHTVEDVWDAYGERPDAKRF